MLTQNAEERRLSLVLLGSLPSGEARMVYLRSQLSAHLFGNGIFNELMDDTTISASTVGHFVGGAGTCSLTLSPWSCPVPPEELLGGRGVQVDTGQKRFA